MAYKPRISVVIPVYKIQQYLHITLDSLLAQTYKNYEILLVGAPGINKAIILSYQLRAPNKIKYYERADQGPGAARNLGIDRALGEYLVFVDSDDYVRKDYLQVLNKKQRSGDYDLVICNYLTINKGLITKPIYGETLPKNKNKLGLLNTKTCAGYPWNKLYKKTLFTQNKIRFPHIFFEDLATIPLLIATARNIGLVYKELYVYRLHNQSSTNYFKSNIFSKRTIDMFKALAWLEKRKELFILSDWEYFRDNGLFSLHLFYHWREAIFKQGSYWENYTYIKNCLTLIHTFTFSWGRSQTTNNYIHINNRQPHKLLRVLLVLAVSRNQPILLFLLEYFRYITKNNSINATIQLQ